MVSRGGRKQKKELITCRVSEEPAQGLFVVQQGRGPRKGRAGAADRERGTGEVGTSLCRGGRAGTIGAHMQGFL